MKLSYVIALVLLLVFVASGCTKKSGKIYFVEQYSCMTLSQDKELGNALVLSNCFFSDDKPADGIRLINPANVVEVSQ